MKVYGVKFADLANIVVHKVLMDTSSLSKDNEERWHIPLEGRIRKLLKFHTKVFVMDKTLVGRLLILDTCDPIDNWRKEFYKDGSSLLKKFSINNSSYSINIDFFTFEFKNIITKVCDDVITCHFFDSFDLQKVIQTFVPDIEIIDDASVDERIFVDSNSVFHIKNLKVPQTYVHHIEMHLKKIGLIS